MRARARERSCDRDTLYFSFTALRSEAQSHNLLRRQVLFLSLVLMVGETSENEMRTNCTSAFTPLQKQPAEADSYQSGL